MKQSEISERLDKLHEEIVEMDYEMQEIIDRNNKVISMLDGLINYLDSNDWREWHHSVLDVEST